MCILHAWFPELDLFQKIVTRYQTRNLSLKFLPIDRPLIFSHIFTLYILFCLWAPLDFIGCTASPLLSMDMFKKVSSVGLVFEVWVAYFKHVKILFHFWYSGRGWHSNSSNPWFVDVVVQWFLYLTNILWITLDFSSCSSCKILAWNFVNRHDLMTVTY